MPPVNALGKNSTTFAAFGPAPAIHRPFFWAEAVVGGPELLLELLMLLMLLELLMLLMLVELMLALLLLLAMAMGAVLLLLPPQLASRPVARRVASSTGP